MKSDREKHMDRYPDDFYDDDPLDDGDLGFDDDDYFDCGIEYAPRGKQ